MDPDQTAPLRASDQGSHCLPVCKNRFEKFARIFSRQHKQTPFSDAGFLGVLRVMIVCANIYGKCSNHGTTEYEPSVHNAVTLAGDQHTSYR